MFTIAGRFAYDHEVTISSKRNKSKPQFFELSQFYQPSRVGVEAFNGRLINVLKQLRKPTSEVLLDAMAKDTAWMLCRHIPKKEFALEVQDVPSWSAFNARVHAGQSLRTTIGYCPLIPAPSSDYSTIYTVMETLATMMNHLGQKHVVVTFDQAIYCKAKEIQWKRANEFSNMVIRLGGFHVVLNFLGTLGNMMTGSGLK